MGAVGTGGFPGILGFAPTAGFEGIDGFGLAAGACAFAPITDSGRELAGVEEGDEVPDRAFLLCHDEGAEKPSDVPFMGRDGASGTPGAAGGARRTTGGGGGGAARCSMSLRLMQIVRYHKNDALYESSAN